MTKTALPLHAALPIVFANCAGLYMPPEEHASPSNTAVLFVSPWGFEEVCLRKFHRQLAEELAARGIPSLRFDYPGTGNSLDIDTEQSQLESWLDSIAQAADALKAKSGCGKIILLGHGLGAMLATAAAARFENMASGLALLAPAYSGRMWLRETGLWWKMIATDLGISGAQPEDGSLTITGLTLPAATAKDIKGMKLSAEMVPAGMDILVAERPGRESDTTFTAELRAAGHQVSDIAFTGHEGLIANPIVQKIPTGLISALADSIRAKAPAEWPQNTPVVPAPAKLQGNGFIETGLRFREDNRLTGILCEPTGRRNGATVIIHGTAYDRSTGWGRSAVETARKLAADGITSLRFDAANVGDSPPLPNASPKVLYTELQVADLKAAVSLLEREKYGPIVLSGRCSGSYAAFQLALSDQRIEGLVLINNIIFMRDPTQELVEDVDKVARPLEEYSARAKDPETFKRLLRGEIDIPAAARNMVKSIGKRIVAKMTPYIGSLSAANRQKARIADAFKTLAARNLPIKLVYADNDVGLEELKLNFGAQVADQPPAPNMEFTLVSNADHNMTPAHANDVVTAEIRKLALAKGK